MIVLHALGIAGGFLLLPKGWLLVTLGLWVLARVNPLVSAFVFLGWLVLGGGR